MATAMVRWPPRQVEEEILRPRGQCCQPNMQVDRSLAQRIPAMPVTVALLEGTRGCRQLRKEEEEEEEEGSRADKRCKLRKAASMLQLVLVLWTDSSLFSCFGQIALSIDIIVQWTPAIILPGCWNSYNCYEVISMVFRNKCMNHFCKVSVLLDLRPVSMSSFAVSMSSIADWYGTSHSTECRVVSSRWE